MPQIASAAHVEGPPLTFDSPPDPERDAIAAVGRRLLDLADDASVIWTASGREQARRVGEEMLSQASDPPK